MIGTGGQTLVGIKARGPISPWFVMSSLDHVEQVRIDTVGDEALSVIVEIDTPGIGGAVGEVLEDQTARMNAVHAAVTVNALAGGRAGTADIGGAGAAMSRIEPAVRPPG